MDGEVHRIHNVGEKPKHVCPLCNREVTAVVKIQEALMCQICYRKEVQKQQLAALLAAESKIKTSYRGQI